MASVEWETPQDFFDTLDAEFHFTLDVCASEENRKCYRYYSMNENGLLQSWRGVFWMNPPHGRGQDVYSWVKKAFNTACAGGTGVCLLPMSGDTKWFHDFCLKASEIRFVKNRLWFSLNGKTQRANHASMVVVFRPMPKGPPLISAIDTKGNRL